MKKEKFEEDKLSNDNLKMPLEDNLEADIKNNNISDEVEISTFEKNVLNRGSKKIAFIILVCVLDLVILFGIIFSINKLNENVYKNVFLLGKDISGKNFNQVVEILKSDKEKSGQNLLLIVCEGNNEIYRINSNDIDFNIDIQQTAKKVFDFGRDSNLFKNNFCIIKTLITKKNIEPIFKFNEEELDLIIKNIDLTLENRKVDASYSIDPINHKLIIKNGVKGNTIDYQEVKNQILNSFKNFKQEKINLNVIIAPPNKLNEEDVYKKVRCDPIDAYIDESVSPYKFISEVVGYDFDQEELKKVLEKNTNEGENIEFTLNVIEPKVKLSDITYKLYNDKLAGYTTYFDPSQSARAKNLSIALQYLNGKVIMPGETFSYNKTVGDITSSKGYLPAATFKGGTVVNEVGGGICQTSSTLYNVSLMANMEIVERHQHGLPVGYVPPSRDATVYFPVLDFKFKNTRKYPVKIVTSFSFGGTVNISIFGTKEQTEYNIVLSNKYISTINYPTKYIYDETLPEGEQQVISNGVNGYVSESYLTKYLNGKYITSYMLSKDTYNPQIALVKLGTLKK
ncbi:MAG: VanW family protein [Clostridia bacterium]